MSFSYGGEGAVEAVQDLNLAIRFGETTAIAGPSGTGKSTIADLVMGLIVPNRGRVLVDAKPLGPERRKSWREQIGYVAQDTFLFNDTIRANLLWARPEAREEEIWEALELAAADICDMNRLMEVDGMRLRKLRREHAWSQRDLARESGVSQDAITRLETGQREAQPRTVRRLAEALGVEPRELMKGED